MAMKLYRLNAPERDEYFSSETLAKKRGMEVYHAAKEKGRSGDLYVSFIETAAISNGELVRKILNDDPDWKASEKIIWEKQW
jgi:hypothetical protein